MGIKLYTKDDAYRTLDTINMWINNCDTKTSIVLGSIGVLSTIILSSDYAVVIKNIIENAFANFNGWNIVFVIIFIFSALSCVTGLYFFVSSITPRIILNVKRGCKNKKRKSKNQKRKSKNKCQTVNNNNKNQETYSSIMFYGIIALKEYSVFKTEVKNKSETFDEIMEDLVFQIHSAARICNSKFKKFQKGMYFFGIGFFVAIILLIFGYY